MCALKIPNVWHHLSTCLTNMCNAFNVAQVSSTPPISSMNSMHNLMQEAATSDRDSSMGVAEYSGARGFRIAPAAPLASIV